MSMIFATKRAAARRSDQDIRWAIERAMDEYAICVLPGQRLADEEQIG
jgi:hypothetical protein